MNDFQKRLLSMFRDVSAVLDSHGIPYYLAYGTDLGAVRHGGFIPWDDDIDIFVWGSDIPRAVGCLSEELGGKYYVHAPKADTHPHVVFRTPDLGDDLLERKAFFIDIFPLERYPSGRIRQFLSFFTIWGIHYSVTIMDLFKRSVRPYRFFLFVPRFFTKLSRALVNDDSDLCVAYTTRFRHEVFPRSYFGTPVKARFEDVDTYVPAENDSVLRQLYGDYMTPPPEGERKGAMGYPLNIYKDYVLDEGKERR